MNPAAHIPVLLDEVIAALKPADGEVYVDGTFGAGGYSRAILEAANCSVIGIDQDPLAHEMAAEWLNQYPNRLHLALGNFAQMADIVKKILHFGSQPAPSPALPLQGRELTQPAPLPSNSHPACGGGKGRADATSEKVGESPPFDSYAISSPPQAGGYENGQTGGLVDGIVLDIGVSSMQFDDAARGFSFQKDAALDMRMSQRGMTAADFLNQADEHEIADVLYLYGEEHASRKIAKAIVARRTEQPITRTVELASIIHSAIGNKGKTDSATKSFQALRIHVNGELDALKAGLLAAEQLLKPKGRLIVVSFHSLEDRIVKQFIASRSAPPAMHRHMPDVANDNFKPSFKVGKPRKVKAGREELARNPRARSAVMRIAIRTDNPAMEAA